MAKLINGNADDYYENLFNLGIQDEAEEELSSLLNSAADYKKRPPSFISFFPTPGVCVKMYAKDDQKLFMNLCHSNELKCSNADSSFLPEITIGHLREQVLKDNSVAKVFDVAINTNVYNKLNHDKLIKLADSAASEVLVQFNLERSPDKGIIVLKNRQYMGKITKMFLKPPGTVEAKNALITVVNSEDFIIPKYRLLLMKPFSQEKNNFYMAEIYLKDVKSSSDIMLDISRDSLHLRTIGNKKYDLEFFFPKMVLDEKCHATFVTSKQILKIILPAVKAAEN